MVNINWTNEAEVWLEDIFNFISEDSKKIAKKVVARFKKSEGRS